MKNVAIGQKGLALRRQYRWRANRAANLMSLIASCKDNRVEPWGYLRGVFTQLPLGTDPLALLPDRWLLQNPTHRWTIADQRADERTAVASG